MTDEVDELKNILAAKVNNDNKNNKKKLDEMKELLEICKKEYQKLYFEHENLRKRYDNLVTQYNKMRKTKLISMKKRRLLLLKILRKSKVRNRMRKMRKKNKLKKKVKMTK